MNPASKIERVMDMAYRIGFLIIPVMFLYMIIGLILAVPLMFLWNFTLPELTKGALGHMNYWQAWALIVMSSILFGGSGPKD